MAKKEAATRFWDFALSVYGQPDARAAFLRLQDRDGADVPMLLWCLWCAEERRGVSRAVMERAVSFSAAWRDAAVTPLRTLRRALKPGITGAPRDLSETARNRVAKTEQALERLQMDHLANLSPDGPPADPATLIALYAQVAGLTLDPADVQALL